MTVHRCDHPTADGTACTQLVDDTTERCAARHRNTRFRPAAVAAPPASRATHGVQVADIDDLLGASTAADPASPEDPARQLQRRFAERLLGYPGDNLDNLDNQLLLAYAPTRVVRRAGYQVQGMEVAFVVDGEPVAVAQSGGGNMNHRVGYASAGGQTTTVWQLVDGRTVTVQHYDEIDVVVVDGRRARAWADEAMSAEERQAATQRLRLLADTSG